jgi:hypothetical protein
MGFFGTFTYNAGEWAPAPVGHEWLRVDIHDSDIATIEYSPAAPQRGRFYLGFQPRDYFQDPLASQPVDNDAEASAFVHWAASTLGVRVTDDQVRSLLADAGAEDANDLFVEDTVRRLLALLGLPLPQDLQQGINP